MEQTISYVALDDQVITTALQECSQRLLRSARQRAEAYLGNYYTHPVDRAVAHKALSEILAGRRPSWKTRNLERWGRCRANTARVIFSFAWFRVREEIRAQILAMPQKEVRELTRTE